MTLKPQTKDSITVFIHTNKTTITVLFTFKKHKRDHVEINLHITTSPCGWLLNLYVYFNNLFISYDPPPTICIPR